ncbi:T9SS type A sorting domain-containing protein [uncultured Pedobacter sp.]|uniref:T9SS type A sorting domain-containing protein n=1 Tax=uncultured Pedobacter sp. TaxID=246139 RepID=UPI00263720F5|nr:T9SS type A sorting domain-containing protein [uncultured Pedobacter sp.]
MKKLYIKSFTGAIALLLTLQVAKPNTAAAALAPGDIAVIGYNSDAVVSTKDFTVVTLATINSGETIYFTDKGWTATSGGSFMADINSEGIFSWTTTATIARGTVINFSVTSGASPNVSATPSVGTISVVNGWTNTSAAAPFGTNGDQILIFQGSTVAPTFIFGFNAGISSADVVNGWQTVATTGNAQSNIPAGLTSGTNAIGFPTTTVTSLDNYAYKGAFTGNKAAVLALICNAANWDGDDAIAYNIVPGSGGGKFPGSNPIFTVNTKPVATLVSNTGTLLLGQVLTGVYTYSDADNDSQSGTTFKWYRADDASGTNKQSTGGTNNTYTLVAADINKFISFEVTPKDGREFGSSVESSLRGPVAGTLPVQLVDFSTKLEGGHAIRLYWKVSEQRNHKKFVIYRKGDQEDFRVLADIAASQGETYTYLDRAPLKGKNYYRLVQVDLDNTAMELANGWANMSASQSDVMVYPNPTQDVATVSLGAGKYERADLISLSGKVLQSKWISQMNGTVSFDLRKMSAGTYLIKVFGNGITSIAKVVRK